MNGKDDEEGRLQSRLQLAKWRSGQNGDRGDSN